jgi:rfaE bifunctional protein kinase chain/domain
MHPARFQAITECYPFLQIAVLGDFCLDRYLEIDPAKQAVSIETGLPVHHVVKVRAQPGGAGTIVNNLSALGIARIYPLGFAGYDGEGFELCRALEQRRGVRLDYFVKTVQRQTFTYCKPLVLSPGKPPVELSRFDLKNWTSTPALLQGLLLGRLQDLATRVSAIIVLDQVDLPETGVITQRILDALEGRVGNDPELLVLADSRRGLRDFPPLVFKMNGAELSALTGAEGELGLEQLKETAAGLARNNSRAVFITLAERGIVGASPAGEVEHVPALPVRGEIDIVGAGDAVSANLTAAIAAGATLREALELANAAASVVIHKLGTTGTASVGEIESVLMRGQDH